MNTTEPPAEMAPNEHDRAAPRSRLKPRLGPAAEAAQRRQFTDTCRVASLPADSGDDATDQPWVGPNRDPLCACPRQRRASFAAEGAARPVPLKRQSGVSLLTRAESRVYPRTRETTRLISHGWVGIVTPFAHARDGAAPRARLKPRLGAYR